MTTFRKKPQQNLYTQSPSMDSAQKTARFLNRNLDRTLNKKPYYDAIDTNTRGKELPYKFVEGGNNLNTTLKTKNASGFADSLEEYVNTDFNPLSYNTIVNQMKQFRQASNNRASDFNRLETPGHYFFKILFHFTNVNSDDLYSNFLGCNWLMPEFENMDYNNDYKFANTAYNFLMINAEYERAEMLKQFITLLSDINSESPWYWNSISGLDNAVDRKFLTDGNFKIEDRKEMIIKCLPDAYDTRIGTLLDLYRAITYSYNLKKEIIPANLRKFDMSIYIFNTPVLNMHNRISQNLMDSEDWAEMKFVGQSSTMNNKRAACKCLEFRNCEIDYNSSQTGISEIDNTEGISPTYVIKIKYDDCFENRYNETMGLDIGDFISQDFEDSLGSTTITPNNNNAQEIIDQITKTKQRLDFFNSKYNDPGHISGDSVVNFNVDGAPSSPNLRNNNPYEYAYYTHGDDKGIDFKHFTVSSLWKKSLGNLYGLSVSKIGVVKKASQFMDHLGAANILNNVTSVSGLTDLAQDIVYKTKHKPASDMIPLSATHRKKIPGYGEAVQMTKQEKKEFRKKQAITEGKKLFYNL